LAALSRVRAGCDGTDMPLIEVGNTETGGMVKRSQGFGFIQCKTQETVQCPVARGDHARLDARASVRLLVDDAFREARGGRCRDSSAHRVRCGSRPTSACRAWTAKRGRGWLNHAPASLGVPKALSGTDDIAFVARVGSSLLALAGPWAVRGQDLRATTFPFAGLTDFEPSPCGRLALCKGDLNGARCSTSCSARGGRQSPGRGPIRGRPGCPREGPRVRPAAVPAGFREESVRQGGEAVGPRVDRCGVACGAPGLRAHGAGRACGCSTRQPGTLRT